MKIRQASPEKSWDKEISQEHRDIYSDIYSAIETVEDGEEADPRAIVGPYGSGKTQLMYEAFNIAWEDVKIPALYTDADAIIRGFTASESTNLADWITQRVRDQVEQLSEGKSVNWLPNFSTKSKKEDWLESVQDQLESSDDEMVILLVDEIEQAYDRLNEQVRTDDDNTFRSLLDEVEGVYQIWSFGLVSAYEILGEADLRRFKELRVPVVEPVDVHRLLSSQDKPVELTNAIWWLARGRAGWVNKLVDEAPSDRDKVLGWFDRVSDYEFFGTKPVNQSIIQNELADQAEVWDNARRSLLFLPGIGNWELDENSLTVERANDTLLNILVSDSNIGSTASRILERNFERVLQAISTNRWTSDGEVVTDEPPRIPITLFTKEEEVEGFINLVQNQITSFEPRDEARGNAIEFLRDISASDFVSSWATEGIETDAEKARTTRPSILQHAYPSIAVDPNVLSEDDAIVLKEELDSPISIDPNIHLVDFDVKVRYCPTNSTANQAVTEAKESKSVPETYLIITPDIQEVDSWDLPSDIEELGELERLTIHRRGSNQLRDFLLQLKKYLEDFPEYQEIITAEIVDDAVVEESDRRKIDTIETLFDQVKRIIKSSATQARDAYKERYSLKDSDSPLWANDDLAGPDVFWHYRRQASIQVNGIAYGLAVTRGQWPTDRDYEGLPDTLERAYEEEYINQSTFKFKEFLELVFKSDGYRKQMENKREEFGTAQESQDPSLERLKELLFYLLDQLAADEDTETDRDEAWEVLTSIDEDWSNIEILESTHFERYHTPAFLGGLLLDGLVQESPEKAIDELEDQIRALDDIEMDISNARNQINDINGVLNPPDDHGSSLEIKDTGIGERISNVSTLKTQVRDLIEHIEDENRQATIGQVLSVIIGRYIVSIHSAIDELIEPLYEYDVVYHLESLESQYNKIHDQLDNSSDLTATTSLSGEELDEQFNIIVDQVFDFGEVLNSNVIGLNDLETLEKVNDYATDQSAVLGEILENLRYLNERQAERISLQDRAYEETRSFLDGITEEDQEAESHG